MTRRTGSGAVGPGGAARTSAPAAPSMALPLALTLAVVLAVVLAPASARAADPDFYQTADRREVGTQEVFRVTVVLSGAPDDAELELPSSEDFETLGTSQSTSRSISIMGGSSPVITSTRTVTLRLRALKPGILTIPPSRLVSPTRTWSTEPLRLQVVRGRLGADPRAQGQDPSDPFAGFPGLPGAQAFGRGPDESVADVPRGDSDLFMRTTVDREEAYVGQQVTMSVWVYSRVDLSSVDAVTMPRLEGFWSEEVDSPTQLSGEPRTVNGVPYRAFLLRRRALFPMRPGTLTVGEAEADITTGFLFAGHRVHRRTRPIPIRVKPLPPGGPQGITGAHVGRWSLTAEGSGTHVELGQPVTVRLVLEGQGNVRNAPVPRLEAPEGFRVYEPTTQDAVAAPRNRVGGRRVVEYLLMPQRTGTFTLPALRFPHFDPDAERYEVASTEPLTLTVVPGAGGAAGPVSSAPGGEAAAGGTTPRGDAPPAAHNVLSGEGGGVRPVRVSAALEPPGAPLHARALFWPAVLLPFGVWLAVGLVGRVRGRLQQETEGSTRRRQTRAAQKRLAEAERLAAEGRSAEFHAEVERALLGFLEAQLRAPVQGLTRDALVARLAEAGVPEAARARVLRVLEACEVGRFAPGGGGPARDRVLADAAAAMDTWGRS